MRLLTTLCAAVLALTITSGQLRGQATEGSILGTVTDSSSAVIAGATVKITSVETGTERVQSTTAEGEFVVTNLSLGSYVVRVEAKGFKSVVHPPVTITVKARIRVDSTLEIGEVTQTVQVTGETPLLKSDTPEVGGVVSREELESYPVFGRNFMELAALVPGTTPGAAVSRQRDFSGAAVTVAGASAEANNFIVDGISNNMEFSGATAVVPALDAMQEFAVQTSQYSAEFGRSGGGVINVAMKSGTNQIHGFAYDYFRNEKLNARPYDFTGVNPPKQPVRRNQFGVGGGGPIKKNRSFLFTNYEGTRNPSNSYSQRTVPTAAERSGNFSASGFVAYDPAALAPDPAAPATQVRQPFPNNAIPSTRFDPIGVKILSYFPDPNYRDPNPGVRTNYLVSEQNKDDLDSFTIKTDNNLSSRDILMGRISQQRGGRLRSSWMPEKLVGGIGKLDATNTGITYTRILRPAMVNETRLGYNYLRFGNEMTNHTDVLGSFKIPGYNEPPYVTGIPDIALRNFTSTTAVRPIASVPNPFLLVEHTWQFMDNVSMQKGKHALKAGAEYGRVANNRFQGRSGGGSLSFQGYYTTRGLGQTLPTLQSGVPDALLGMAYSFSTQYAFDAIRIRSVRFSSFLQDEWRLTRRLTLSLGLRYDFYGPYSEAQGRIGNFDLSTGTRIVPEQSRQAVIRTLGLPNGDLPAGWRYDKLENVMPHKNWRNFAPRFGFAYAAHRRLVIRGGYGIFYGVTVSNNANNAGTEGGPFFFDFGLASDLVRPILVKEGFPSGGLTSLLSARTFSAYYGPLDRKDPYTHKYSLNLQTLPFRQLAVEVGYTGQRALAFATLVAGNVPLPGPGTVQDRRPFPNVGGYWMYLPIADSNYNALEITFRQKRWHGLSVHGAFTFSKVLGYTQGTDGQSATDHINNPYDYRYDYGVLNFDMRKRLVIGWTYDVPKVKQLGLVGRHILNRWQLSGINNWYAGFPYSVGVTGPTLNNGSGTNRANKIREAEIPVSERTVNRWFDTTAFTLPPNYVWGAQGKNTMRGPGVLSIEFAMQKSIPVAEGKLITIRMEAQNFLNTVQYGMPSATAGSTSIGTIRSLSQGPRNIQLAGRFTF
jgi:hypothetical protein